MVEETSDYGDIERHDADTDEVYGRNGQSSNTDNSNTGSSSLSSDRDPSSSNVSVDRIRSEFDRHHHHQQYSVHQPRSSSKRKRHSSSSSLCRKSQSRNRIIDVDVTTASKADVGGEDATSATIKVDENDKCNTAADADDEPDEDPTQKSVKSLFYNTLENDFQCPICNEMIVKACTANCGHAFCRNCIRRWIKINKICPVCRASVRTITNCIPVDTFITNICELIGGTVKEQRDKLLKERIPEPTVVRRKRRRLRSPDVHNQ